MGKCRGHLLATLEFEIFPFIPLSLETTYLRPISFIRKIYLSLTSARLYMIFDHLGMPISNWCNEFCTSNTQVLKNASPARPGEKYLISISHSGVVQKEEIQIKSFRFNWIIKIINKIWRIRTSFALIAHVISEMLIWFSI